MTDDKCARDITWAGGSHTFNLNHPWVRNVLSFRGLPGPNGDTPAACLSRFDAGTYSIDDVERVLKLGLIGGGMTKREADAVLTAHVRGKPLAPNVMIALEVLAALFVGDANAARA
jgi:hypothetical protein